MNREELRELITAVFKGGKIVQEERTLIGMRGCIERGGVDIGDFSHCGNEECSSCNNLKDLENG